jgi:hypothetical protein
MTILSKQNFSNTYLTSSGTWPDNSIGEINAAVSLVVILLVV